MSDKSRIEWTDASWNPFRGTRGRHHCVRISEGCKHCYAATMNHRFGGPDYVKGADKPRLDNAALLWPLSWKGAKEAKAEGRASRIFVCSMTDLFLDAHTTPEIFEVFGIMASASHHTFQVLTKRPARMRSLLADMPPLPNVWLGVSCENQERAEERIPDLLATPAAVRFVSAEPLLGPIRLDRIEEDELGTHYNALSGIYEVFNSEGPRLSWVIVGGESGPGARPCDVSWIRSIKDQCHAAGVPVFVKQLGAKPKVLGALGRALDFAYTFDDRKGGDPSEWPEDLRVRQMPREPA